MARIRSVHPGFWSDETMVCLRVETRLFLIGLWNECDDQGAFEWKPLGLKMRIFPADNFDVSAMLSELEAADVVKSYELSGRRYGVVRNFAKFQRPKKPNSVHPMTCELRTYAGLPDVGSEPVPHQFPTSSENPPQMEEEDGEGGGKKEESARAIRLHPANGSIPTWGDARIVPAGIDPKKPPDHPDNLRNKDRPTCNGTYVDWLAEKLADETGLDVVPFADKTMLNWLADGYESDQILPVVRRLVERGAFRKSLAYFDKAVREGRPTWHPLKQERAA